MPLSSVSQQSSIRFSEVQSLLTYIKALRPAPAEGLPQPIPNNLAILRGLFFVHLYGAFEYSTVEIIKAVATIINGRGIQVGHLETGIYPLALEPQLTAIKDAGPKTKWEKRAGLFEMQASTNVVRLHEGVMLQDLQNVDGQVVNLIYSLFALPDAPLKSPATGGYLDEIKLNRNSIAHGRESPIEVQKRTPTDAELQKRLDIANEQVQYMIACFESHLNNKTFIRPPQRRHY